ncbi:hypothetical protein J40TS1_21600 [Paenibacillus montaniterrae]|uniref:Lipoprotein n=1 Tax=Paenibacillus montaniterrae TaxID=429341 RepID=A0A919YTD4_9BACL|nr:DUF6612 family protein [Paenibacillus montaniterrae]GIP16518.1 hypothetical protein J40TS1_21600 [Paenibacillus montaniterrae]
MKKLVRKSLMSMLLVLSLVLLAACGESDPKSTGTPVQQENGNKETNTGSSAETDKDLFVAVVSEASGLDSFSINMTADQKIEADGEVVESKTVSAMDITVKPEVAFKQVTTIEAAGQKQEMEAYLTAEGFFVKDLSSGMWVKLPADAAGQVLQGVDQESLDPSAQLSQLVDYADQFTVEEKDGVYVFTLSAKGEEFSKLIEEQLAQQQETMAQLGSVTVDSIQYNIEVEKSSNKLLKLDVVFDMTVENSEAAQSMKIVSNIETEYSNHNAIEAIVVPEEALGGEEVTIE